MEKKNNKGPTKSAEKVIRMQDLKTDPNGSYTGIPEDPYEVPVQDADDL